MGIKFLWTGLTFIEAFPTLGLGGFELVGGVLMFIGAILLLLNK